jgi:hypothetical protein
MGCGEVTWWRVMVSGAWWTVGPWVEMQKQHIDEILGAE